MPVDGLDIAGIGRLIADVAAHEILPRFRTLSSSDIREKGPGDLVTTADLAAERRLARDLPTFLRGSLVLGEEAAAEDPSIMNLLREDAPVWVVDPLDGTGNYSRGTATFAVIVALVCGDRTHAGWIHDPVKGLTAVAVRGGGATLETRPLRVAAPARPADMRGTLHGGRFGNAALRAKLLERRDRVNAIRSLNCAGLEYMRLCRGETHFTLFTRLMPWDHAAGVLLHEEAGGWARYLDDDEYRPSLVSGGRALLMAPDRDSWASLRDTLFGDDGPPAV